MTCEGVQPFLLFPLKETSRITVSLSPHQSPAQDLSEILSGITVVIIAPQVLVRLALLRRLRKFVRLRFHELLELVDREDSVSDIEGVRIQTAFEEHPHGLDKLRAT